MSQLPCTEVDPCLWNYQEHSAAFYRWSAVKNTGTIEKINMQVQPLEEDWIEFEFAAGKAPKYNPVEEFVEDFGLETILPPLLEENSGEGTPFKWDDVPITVWDLFNPDFPFYPGIPGGCHHHCGTPDNPIIPEQPAQVPIPAGVFMLPVGMVIIYLFKKLRFTKAA